MKPRCRAFTLVEVVIGTVFLGAVLAPFLVFVMRIQELNHVVGQQGRAEAARSFTDQVIVQGIDPSRASALSFTSNSIVPPMAAPDIRTEAGDVLPGLPRITLISKIAPANLAEPRLVGAGFQIGAGPSVVPRGAPMAPLTPVIMPSPTLLPDPGTNVSLFQLARTHDGSPYTVEVKASGAIASTVHLVLNRPTSSAEGFGTAQRTVSSADLAAGVSGIAWAEYSGDPSLGDRPITLPDGRIRWIVTTAERRSQIYEPSPAIAFGYHLDIGGPVMVYGGTELASGAVVDFDFAAYVAVQRAVVPLSLDYPANTKAAFGTAWEQQSIGFRWTFADSAGEFAGALRPFFQPDTLAIWNDSVRVVAVPVIPPGTVATAGDWTIRRTKTVLTAPVLNSSSDASGIYAAGEIDFSAPTAADGNRIGRLSFENGTMLSTGATLAMPVVP